MPEVVYRKTLSGKGIRWFIILFLVVFPFFGGLFLTYLVTVALIFGIYAMAYDLFYGYAGLVSFGHSAFYGVPAYALGAVAVTVFNISNPLVLLGSAILMGAILGVLVGYVCTFTRGIYMALVTFAFAQIFWLLVLSDPGGITYGENGIMGIKTPPIHMVGLELDLFSGRGLYLLVFAILVAVYLIIRAVVNSQIGDILGGIKHNEDRLLSLGYNVRPYKILAFVLTGIFSAIAAALMVFLNDSIVPSMVDWHVGAEILLITMLGGPGTLIGPIIGAFAVVFTESYASSWIGGGNWLYVMGSLYIGVILFLPGGIFNTKFVRSLQ